MAEVTIDPNIYVRPSEQLMNIIKDIANPTQEIRNVLDSNEKLTAKDLSWLRKNISKEAKAQLYQALKSSTLELPSPVYPERNPELEARCQKLRREQEERDYQAMTRNVRDVKNDDKPLSVQLKELNNILVVMFQFFISIGTAFAFGYLAPFYLWGREETGPRLLLGTLAAFFIGIADLYFVIREHLSEDGVKFNKKLD
eukprot:TRINITY_DN38860_c0_g1_i1.p1 TRINITY_DN38860_c0_g1~~TRINITY_DN38860_c0_g1_i1.p1  ORF type:complete len:199 (+),score=19.40 TRINITY_DN38860_c0_g1_i1:352-948(+)